MTATSHADLDEDDGDRRPMRAALIVWFVLFLLTAASAWAADRVDDKTESRLLQVQTKQAAAALSTTVLLIQQPLATVLSVQDVAGPDGDPESFRQQMKSTVGDGRLLASASLWRRGADGALTRIGRVGAPPLMEPASAEGTAFLRSAFEKGTFVPRLVGDGDRLAMAFALADRASEFVVYAERLIPQDRRSPVDRDAAFADLRYAIYLGPEVENAALATTGVDPTSLPLEGETYQTSIPFGTSELTFVTSPRRHLGAPLSQNLPLILLLGGLALTAIASVSAHQLVRARQRAERGRVEQRDISERLQRAVLPHVNPRIPQLDIASEYLAGTQGVDIGGDWYSIIGLDDDDTFGFVVGDVSGHGVDAVAVMAHARFTLRAYLIDGKSPSDALEKCSRQFDITVDGHMTTAVVGVGNWRTGEVTLANAGHPAPLHITDAGAEFVTIPTGPPLGTGRSTYRSTTIWLRPGEALLAYTDGLIERRGEPIDLGMDRLRAVVGSDPRGPIHDLVQRALVALHHEDAADDIAVLGIRRHGSPVPSAPVVTGASG